MLVMVVFTRFTLVHLSVLSSRFLALSLVFVGDTLCNLHKIEYLVQSVSLESKTGGYQGVVATWRTETRVS